MLQNIIKFTAEPATGSGFSFGSIFAASLDPLQVFFTFLLALIIGVIIFLVYKATFAGVMYSRSFNISLIMLTLVTSLMLLPITSNLALSLGMVGALSIIRFRTAVKDPIDTVFMFWAVGEGIAIGAGFYDVTVYSVICIGLFLVVIGAVKVKGAQSYLLIIRYDEVASATVKQLMAKLPKARLKSKTVRPNGIEITIEVRLKDSETAFVERLAKVEGVYDAALISHQGDIVA